MTESRVAEVLRRFREGESLGAVAETALHPRSSTVDENDSADWIEDILRAYLLGIEAGRRTEGDE